MKSSDIILCNESCIYDISNNKTIIIGEYIITKRFSDISITNIDRSKISLIYDNQRVYIGGEEKWGNNHDFCLKIEGKINKIENIKFIYNKEKNIFLEFNNVICYFPFENNSLSLNKNSAIITTMCKDYGHRLDEWIQYNIKLGFSAIIIFDNDENVSNKIDEEHGSSIKIKNVCDKYKDKVLCINFPYSPLGKDHWNQIQRIMFHISLNAFKYKCRNIALIDADEFIYFPREKDNNIEEFLSNYDTTIQFKSNILTNKSSSDHIDNNVLKIAKYIGDDRYTKVIIHTSNLIEDIEFWWIPHHYKTQKKIEKDVLIHYHCWINNRYQWKPSMRVIDLNN
tara:strand:+ start:159 stop:1175 length:1017 start_codon:yes stop_codon:yes gene_type:complete